MRFQDDVIAHYQAGVNGIWITSHEESRVLPELKAAVEHCGLKRAFVWSIARGLVSLMGEREFVPGKEGLGGALGYLGGLEEGGWITVFCDPHDHFTTQTVRIFRELFEYQEERISIFISPKDASTIPLELQKLVVALEFTLPDIEQLTKEITRVCKLKSKPAARLLAESAAALTLHEAAWTSRLALAKFKDDYESAAQQVWECKAGLLGQNGLVTVKKPKRTWDEMGGVYEFKKHFEQRLWCFTSDAMARGLDIKGMIFTGRYGVGKTLLCEVIASVLGRSFLEANLGRLMGPFVGTTEANTRQFIQTVNAHQPCVVMIDELAAQFSGFESSGYTDSGVTARMVGDLLSWLVGGRPPGVLVIGSTNEPWKLPPQLARPGRMGDQIWHLPVPDQGALTDILSIHRTRYCPDVEIPRANVKELVEAMKEKELVGAEVEQVVIETVQGTYPRCPTPQDFLLTISKVVPTSQVMREQCTRLDEWVKGRARPA